MNDKIILIGVLAVSITFALESLRKLWKERADLAEEKVDRIIAELNDLPVYRAYQTEFCREPLIKTWIRCSGPEAIYVAVKRAFNWRDPFANYPFVDMDVEKVDQLIREPKCQKK